jgi:Protein of unknown function (DUF1236)
MKSTILAAIGALTLAGPALAQSTVVTSPAPRAGAAVTIAPEQRAKIKQYVVQHQVRSYPMQQRIAVGTTLPTDVELTVVPSEWGPGLGGYRYVYSGNYIGLVEPSSRRVIEVIE